MTDDTFEPEGDSGVLWTRKRWRSLLIWIRWFEGPHSSSPRPRVLHIHCACRTKHGPGKDHQRLYLPRTSVRTAGVERDSDAFLPIKCVMLCLILTVSAAVNTSLLRNTTRTVGCTQMIAGNKVNFYNLTRYFCCVQYPASTISKLFSSFL